MTKTTKHVDHHITITVQAFPKLIFHLLFWTKEDFWTEKSHKVEINTNEYTLTADSESLVKETFGQYVKKTHKLVTPFSLTWNSITHELHLNVNYNIV